MGGDAGLKSRQVPVQVMGLYLRDPADVLPLYFEISASSRRRIIRHGANR